MTDVERRERVHFADTDTPEKTYASLLQGDSVDALEVLTDIADDKTGHRIAACAALALAPDVLPADAEYLRRYYANEHPEPLAVVTGAVRTGTASSAELTLAVMCFDPAYVHMSPLGKRPVLGRAAYARRQDGLWRGIQTYMQHVHGMYTQGHNFDSALITLACDAAMGVEDAEPEAQARQRNYLRGLMQRVETPRQHWHVSEVTNRYLRALQTGQPTRTREQYEQRQADQAEYNRRYVQFLYAPPSRPSDYVDPSIHALERLTRWGALTAWAMADGPTAPPLAMELRPTVVRQLHAVKPEILQDVANADATLAEVQAVLDGARGSKYSIFESAEVEACQNAVRDYVRRRESQAWEPQYGRRVRAGAERSFTRALRKMAKGNDELERRLELLIHARAVNNWRSGE